MPSFDEAMLAELEIQFGSIRQGTFVSKQLAQTPHEELVGPGQINPVGWVINADSDGLGASVTIDSDGITIRNGRLLLADQFGNNVITGGGFGTSWTDFIESRYYNGRFEFGTLAAIVAATEVSGADSSTDYAASLSKDIPYWIVASYSSSGGGSLGREVDATASGGFCLAWNGNVTAKIYQDVPVTPNNEYLLEMAWRHTADGSNTFNRVQTWSWRDKDHALIGTETEQGIAYNFTQATYYLGHVGGGNPALAPTNARYARIGVKFQRTAGTPVVRVNSFLLRDLTLGQEINLTTQIIVGDEAAAYTKIGTKRIEFVEDTGTGGPGANKAQLYARDNGAGKTQLVVIFNTGVAQVLATEP